MWNFYNKIQKQQKHMTIIRFRMQRYKAKKLTYLHSDER